MNTLIIYDSTGVPLDNLFQWDVSQKITAKAPLVYGNYSTPMLHFSNKKCGIAYVAETTVGSVGADGMTTMDAVIPGHLLEKALPIDVYLYEKDEASDAYRTTAKTKFVVIPRAKPEDYDDITE